MLTEGSLGRSWQVTPKRMLELLGAADPERARRAKAVAQMVKIDIGRGGAGGRHSHKEKETAWRAGRCRRDIRIGRGG
ncbi:MAG TPA: hypothetical protein VD994_14020 [Prosthecobacter sp.]|nr:hypothetical protein [Prosthecobacter sp.]